MSQLKTNPDGSLRPFTAAEVAALDLRTTGVRDGQHPTRRLDPLGCQFVRDWFCKWDKADAAVAHLLGGARVYFDAGQGQLRLSRVMPQPVPGHPKFLAVAVESITGANSAGRDDSTGVPAYKDARLAVRHELTFFDTRQDSLGFSEYERYTENLPTTTETVYLTLQGGLLNYVRPDGVGIFGAGLPAPHLVPIPYSIGRPETQAKVGFKWWRIPQAGWGAGKPLTTLVRGDPAAGRQPLIGTVNKVAFQGYAAGTLLLTGVDEEVVPDPVDEDYCYNLTFWFLFKPQTHNYLWYGGLYSDGGVFNGYYLARRGSPWVATGSIPDGVCLFNERDHRLAWEVSGT